MSWQVRRLFLARREQFRRCGDEPAASLADGPPAERSQITPVADNEDPFIPMPSHLTTHAEMTRELPMLTEGMVTKPHGG
jgi:hypothetical protein